MKRNIKNILTGVVGASLAAGLWSCAAETPFQDEGTGTVHLHTMVSNITTRAVTGYTDQELKDKCVVYITRANGDAATESNKDGLVYRKKGLDNVDENIILKTGHYIAEAWTGDSVPVSYDKKFFRAYSPFDVTKGSITSVSLPCKIQNVIVSFNPESSALEYMNDDYSITIHNESANLVLDKDHLKGYFMIPDVEDAEESLTYTVTGTRKDDGKTFVKTGIIEDVKRAWEYTLSFEYNPPTADFGSIHFFNIDIEGEGVGGEEEKPLVATDPTITGVGYNITDQWDFTDDNNIPDDIGVMICAVGDGLSKMSVTSGTNSFDLNTAAATWKEAGIEWIAPTYDASTKVSTAYLLFKKKFILSLADNTEHVITISVTDKSNKTTTTNLKIKR